MLYDVRAVLPAGWRTVIALHGPQAGAIAHLIRNGAEASLCGLPRGMLATWEDLDEPVCRRCIAWLDKLQQFDS